MNYEEFYKKSHALEVNPDRVRNQRVCLIVEAKDRGKGKVNAFFDLGALKGIEKTYPIVYREVSHLEDLPCFLVHQSVLWWQHQSSFRLQRLQHYSLVVLSFA